MSIVIRTTAMNYKDPSTDEYIGINLLGGEGMLNSISESIASTYSKTTSYSAGDLVMYRHRLYKCTASTSGVWDSSKWQETTIANEL